MKTTIPCPTLLVVGPEAFWSSFTVALQQAGFTVIHGASPTEALVLWNSSAPDAILIAHPPDNKEHLLLMRRLRPETVVPLLLLTWCADEASILQAYEAGADDVLLLPMSPPLLVAKAMAWVRRTRMVSLDAFLTPLAGQGLTLDPPTRTAFLPGGQAVRLTVLEFRLLYILMAHRGQPVSTDRLLRWVWGYQGNERDLLKRLVYRLRRKVELDPEAPYLIRTVRGVGYAFGPEEECPQGPRPWLPEKLGPTEDRIGTTLSPTSYERWI